MLQTLVILGAVFTFLLVIWRWNYNFWAKRRIGGPKPTLLLGNFPNYFKRNFIYDLDDIYKQYRGGCPFVGIYAIRTPRAFVTDPEFSKRIMTSNFRQFHNNEVVEMINLKSDPIVGLNPFWMPYEEWKGLRQEIAPAFSNIRVKSQFPIIESSCEKMVNYLKNRTKSHGSSIKVSDISRRYTNENLMNCIFGIEAHAFESENPNSLQFFIDCLSEFEKNNKFFLSGFIFPLFKRLYKYRLLNPKVRKYLEDMLMHGIAFRKESPGSRDDFLAFLMQLQEKKGSSTNEMVAHALTFILDGFETSAIVLDWIFYQLARDRRVQDKLRRIIEEELKNNGGKFTFETLSELPYLDQVINETMRLNPPILFFMKQCNESLEVPFNNGEDVKTFPKGVTAIMSMYPSDFYPERFDDGAIKDYKDKGVFVPFGDGPRICIGMRFAIAQIKAATAEVVRNFNLTLSPGMSRDLKLTKSFFGVPENEISVDFNLVHE
uniref:Cytochrome n=1 Tax=Lutzomyia longipalpis TaxID=7200 RepID=A0A1B0CWG5_LUTLO